MLLSAHANITNPLTYGYPFIESIKTFLDLCDEVVIVNGACKFNGLNEWITDDDGSVELIKQIPVPEGKSIKIINSYWNDKDWSWEELGKHMDVGYQACSGDFVFRFDVDYMFHEKCIESLRNKLMNVDKYAIPPKVFSVHKLNVMTADTYFPKSLMPFIVNKKDWPNLGYGIAYDTDIDFMAAIDVEGEKNGIKYGCSIIPQANFIREANAQIWCYDFTFMTYEEVDKVRRSSYIANNLYYFPIVTEKDKEDWGRAAMGRFRKMMIKRMSDRTLVKASVSDHPKHIQERISHINKDMFGFNLFNWQGDIPKVDLT